MQLCGSAAIVICVWSGVAFAGADKATAEAAFRHGRELMQAQKYDEACAAFETSQALDPQFGTEYNLASCYEKTGRLASAWGAFRELAQRDSNQVRKAEAAKHASALQPRLIKLVIDVAAPMAGLKITRNGIDISPAVGFESPVDPGDYEIAAAADGYVPWSTRVAAKQEGRTVHVTVPRLDKPPEIESPRPVAPPPTEPARTPSLGEPGSTTKPLPATSNRKLIGFITGGTGIAVTGAGLVFGARALGKWNDAKKQCGGDADHCTATGMDLSTAESDRSSARTAGNVASVLVGLGVAALATGVVLYVTAPSGQRTEHVSLGIVPTATQDGFAITADGRF